MASSLHKNIYLQIIIVIIIIMYAYLTVNKIITLYPFTKENHTDEEEYQQKRNKEKNNIKRYDQM